MVTIERRRVPDGYEFLLQNRRVFISADNIRAWHTIGPGNTLDANLYEHIARITIGPGAGRQVEIIDEITKSQLWTGTI